MLETCNRSDPDRDCVKRVTVMAAPKGNEYYLLRSKDGRETEYQPAELLEVANEYFNWCLDNPLLEETIQKRKINRDEEIIEKVTLNKMRPFTLQGFCNYAEITLQTFKNYEAKEDFFVVATRIRGVIEGHQFEGAAAGFLNANIIARKLGLVDKSELKADLKVEQITGMEIK